MLQIWENMNRSNSENCLKKCLGFFLLAIVCFLNTFPLFFISVLANLYSVRMFLMSLDNLWAYFDILLIFS